jgi:hypothetical protein
MNAVALLYPLPIIDIQDHIIGEPSLLRFYRFATSTKYQETLEIDSFPVDGSRSGARYGLIRPKTATTDPKSPVPE